MLTNDGDEDEGQLGIARTRQGRRSNGDEDEGTMLRHRCALGPEAANALFCQLAHTRAPCSTPSWAPQSARTFASRDGPKIMIKMRVNKGTSKKTPRW